MTFQAVVVGSAVGLVTSFSVADQATEEGEFPLVRVNAVGEKSGWVGLYDR